MSVMISGGRPLLSVLPEIFPKMDARCLVFVDLS